jgi:hypothetical protein
LQIICFNLCEWHNHSGLSQSAGFLSLLSSPTSCTDTALDASLCNSHTVQVVVDVVYYSWDIQRNGISTGLVGTAPGREGEVICKRGRRVVY